MVSINVCTVSQSLSFLDNFIMYIHNCHTLSAATLIAVVVVTWNMNYMF
jgi:hypothetical protein